MQIMQYVILGLALELILKLVLGACAVGILLWLLYKGLTID